MYSRFRREANRPRRTRTNRESRYRSSYHGGGLMNWFYRLYGNPNRRVRAAERDREYLRAPPANNDVHDDSLPTDVEMASEEDLISVIHVTSLNLHAEKNAKSHRTDAYDIAEDREDDNGEKKKAELVLRRGQQFDMTLTFNRQYDVETDDVTLIFSIGEEALSHKKTLVKIPMNETKRAPDLSDPNQWTAAMTSQTGNDVTLSVHVAANCIIGEWDLSVLTIVDDGSDTPKTYEYKSDEPVYILLNPWCKDDTVYMPTTELLDEYVMNEVGYQYYGNHWQIGAMPWLFGQFEEGILEISLTILRLAFNGKISDKMADPVRIARALSQAVNSSDEGGVLTGNWSGNYEGGSRPTSWNGSVDILLQYRATRKPVKFGQCWVFSGVLTTVCRALGLPARSVTNFRSAHDTDQSVAIDKHYHIVDDVREFLDEYNRDSIWNFHVWNDAWMARPDLGAGFDGWQAIDATPQETSDGVYCCGPCPVSAIKNGQITAPYDGVFIFAEVNGHVIHWKRTGPSDWEVTDVDKKDVGRRMSTKEPFSHKRVEVTHEYKFQDGSNKEMKVMGTVAEYLGDGAREYLVPQNDVSVEMRDRDGITIGSPFDVSAVVKNLCGERRTLKSYIVAMVTTYTGVVTRTLKSEVKRSLEILPGQELPLSMNVSFEEYYPHLVEGAAMKVRVQVTVLENKQNVMAEDDFRLRKPGLDITTRGTYKVKEPMYVTMEFTNPLQVPLTNCQIKLDARNIAGGPKNIRPQQQVISPGEKLSETIEIVPKRAGKKEIIATFESEELWEISGSVEVEIK